MFLKNRFLLRLWLIAALMCGGANSFGWVGAKECASDCKKQKDEQVSTYDGLVKGAMEESEGQYSSPQLRSQPQQRVGSSRSSRVMPTHGGKPGRNIGGWNNHYSYNPLNYIHLALSEIKVRSAEGVASPRLYYVIALRRILC